MNLILTPATAAVVFYPDSDGKPMSDNTKQARWIVMLFGNLSALFAEVLDVFVAADLLWYPVENDPDTRVGPDVMVAFGRPKGDRGSYRQWEEEGIPPTVVFEVLSPGNDAFEMADKLAFYDEYGVQEYYLYDPDSNRLAVFIRRGTVLRRVRQVEGFVSPNLGIRFELLPGPEMRVFYPNGTPFLSFEEIVAQRNREHQRADLAEQRADAAEQRAGVAEQRAGVAEQRAGVAEQRAARLAALSRKARRGQASAEELAELDRLEGEEAPPA
jgi:Uma2 family endonuclease